MLYGVYQDEDGLGLFGEEARVIGLLVADAPEEFVFVAAVEGRLADDHFVEEDAERPPVDALVVLQPFDDLNVNSRHKVKAARQL